MDWTEKAYSRLLIDNHITDINPRYMSCFDSEEYVRNVKLSGTESAMVYACCHNGNCYFPTKVGHTHKNLKEDIFGKVVDGLNREGIIPIAYYTVVYHNDFAKNNPDTAIVDNVGRTHSGRYYYSCPNNPKSAEFFMSQIEEILQYDIQGIFIDMTFWPAVCLCNSCREKFGRNIPEVIDWSDPDWVAFQRFREESMAEFAQKLTDFVRKTKPGITVTHQFSPMLHGWYLGQSEAIAKASDYCSGDFYGDKIQQRFGIKAFDSLTVKSPYEFMTSRCVNLNDHTSSKCDEELILSAMTSLANGGAYFFIDAINPDGTLEKSFYERLGKINVFLEPYKNFIKDNKMRLTGNTGLYFSMASCMNEKLNGTRLSEFSPESASNMDVRQNDVLDETVGAAETLTDMHVPYRVVTDSTEDFSGFDTIFIHNSMYLDEKICDRLRNFVRDGGKLVVTGATSLYDYKGKTTGNFALADVMGVDFLGEYSPSMNYTGKEKILAKDSAPLVKAGSAAVLEKLTFPDYPVGDENLYASIHSNPPGEETDYPAVTENVFGKGKCMWIASPFIMLKNQYTQKEYAKKLFGRYVKGIETDIPACGEITFLSGKKKAVCLVNMQNQYPPVPLWNVYLAFETEKPNRVVKVSDGKEADWEYINGKLTIRAEKLIFGEFFV
ncbi:MAG: beta-galactosidase trimerization domain-containing protein, partial [Armatimonadetes bacterium]|nr:beta-galactosidase trimerization domain-containing protein [Candidatus Hippobium faecium]